MRTPRDTNAALDDGTRHWSAEALESEAARCAAALRAQGVRVVASLLDNGPAWVVLDRAIARAGAVHVPLPLFFTPAQMAHAMDATGADTCVGAPASLTALGQGRAISPLDIAGTPLWLARSDAPSVTLPFDTAKVSFTSGSTGAPKGVCLSHSAMQYVADGLVQALAPLRIERHLCALPLPVLLENIAGWMAPRASGATCCVLPLADLGLAGAAGFDAARFQATVAAQQPHSLILLPQMLRAWTAHLAHTRQRAPASLRFVAVGGAAVGAPLLHAARAAGIPAYEGYGLSEGASVQTLNLPGADRPGSAGRPLPHARLRVAADGELEVAGSLFAGYAGDESDPGAWWPTGDLGEIDADGFVHLRGRKKNLLITAYGRNVSPEWVETALRGDDAVLQAAVFGDGEAALWAVLWPTQPRLPDAALQAAVDAANAGLPDYARIAHWVRACRPFDAAAGMSTANGRPRRDAILQAHRDRAPLTDRVN